MKMIVGLGNPGPKHANNRHNIGFIIVEHLAGKYAVDWHESKRFKGKTAEAGRDKQKLLFLEPLSFMNESGTPVRAAGDYYKLTADDILVIHDDADIDFGKLRLVQGGSDGGHRGVMSLYSHGLDNVWRLKVGVANSRRLPGQAIDFVLTDFEPGETIHLEKLAGAAGEIAEGFASGTIKPVSINWLG